MMCGRVMLLLAGCSPACREAGDGDPRRDSGSTPLNEYCISRVCGQSLALELGLLTDSGYVPLSNGDALVIQERVGLQVQPSPSPTT